MRFASVALCIELIMNRYSLEPGRRRIEAVQADQLWRYCEHLMVFKKHGFYTWDLVLCARAGTCLAVGG